MKQEIKETVTIERVKSVDTFCDLCGKDCDLGYGSYDVHEVRVRCKTGSRYPESGMGEEYAPDICVECFKDKVIPAMKALGCTVEWKDWSW